MRQSLVISARAMDALTQRMAVTSNNLANINTVGYKKDLTLITSFRDALNSNINSIQDTEIPSNVKSVTDFSPGNFRFTNDKLNMALQGEGFFKIQLENGQTAYTRKGTFKLDNQNRLVAGDNQFVLGKNGVITIPEGEFSVDREGVIRDKDGNEFNQITTVNYPKPYALEKNGNSMFVTLNSNQAELRADIEIKQMYVEESNVDELSSMLEMISMMESMRQYESNQKVVQLQDQATGQLLSQIGRV